MQKNILQLLFATWALVILLCIGAFNNTHFQSLLKDEPEEETHGTDEDTPSSDESEKDMEVSQDSEKDMDISQESESGMDVSQPGEDDKCPSCNKKLKNVLLHISKSSKCKSSISDLKLKKLEDKSKAIRRQKQAAFQSKKRSQLRKDNADKEKEKERNWKSRNRSKLRDENPDKEMEKERNWKSGQRDDKNQADRLKNFQEATMFGPLFLCISCHGKMFKNGVKIFSDSLKQEIEMKIPIKDCIADIDVITKVITEQKKSTMSTQQRKEIEVGTKFICNTCHRYLKAGKLPPSSAMNCLQLHDTDEDLKNQDLQLTELEGALIAPNIIFQHLSVSEES